MVPIEIEGERDPRQPQALHQQSGVVRRNVGVVAGFGDGGVEVGVPIAHGIRIAACRGLLKGLHGDPDRSQVISRVADRRPARDSALAEIQGFEKLAERVQLDRRDPRPRLGSRVTKRSAPSRISASRTGVRETP